MAIFVPDGLPALEKLKKENLDIRPYSDNIPENSDKILILNLMPTKQVTETQLIRMFADAKKDYNNAIKLDPFDPELHIALGSTKLHLNEFENAIASFDTALIINPNNADAYINRGVAKRFLNRLDDAIEDLNKAVYYDFFNIDGLYMSGVRRIL